MIGSTVLITALVRNSSSVYSNKCVFIRENDVRRAPHLSHWILSKREKIHQREIKLEGDKLIWHFIFMNNYCFKSPPRPPLKEIKLLMLLKLSAIIYLWHFIYFVASRSLENSSLYLVQLSHNRILARVAPKVIESVLCCFHWVHFCNKRITFLCWGKRIWPLWDQ